MRYDFANTVGTKCEGRIQCTFAGIYENNHPNRPLFSVQHKGVRFKMYRTNLNNGQGDYVARIVADRDVPYFQFGKGFQGNYYNQDQFIDAASFEDIEDWKASYYGDFNFGAVGAFPLVYTETYSPDKYVPAHLTREGLALIKRDLLGLDDTENWVSLADINYNNATAYEVYLPIRKEGKDLNDWILWENNKLQEGDTIYERYVFGIQENAEQFIEDHPEITDDNIYVSRDFKRYDNKNGRLKRLKIGNEYKKVLNLKESDTIFIKPAAFDWMPLDFNDLKITKADGETIDLTEEIAKTERKIKFLKAAKMAAIGGTIIL